jgi:YggT family protein
MRLFLETIDIALGIYIWPVFAVALMVWLKGFNVVSLDSNAVAVIDRVLARVTGPALGPIRYFFPPPNGVDFSPLILIIEIMAIRYLILLYILPTYY